MLLGYKAIIAKIADNGRVTYETLPDVRQIDYITRALHGVADKADGAGKLGGQTPLGAAYNNLASNLRKSLKGEVPEYAKALNVASDAISRVKAGETGYDLLRAKTKRGDIARAMIDASAAEKQAAKQGIPLPEAMQQSGHRSLQQAANYYNDANREKGRAAKLME